jgi:hypothetical protein
MVGGFLGSTAGVIVWIVVLLTGALAIVREVQIMYWPTALPPRRIFWSFVRIAFVIAAALLWSDEHQRVTQLLTAKSESPNSLRRRTQSLARDCESYLNKRKAGHPPYTDADPKASPQQQNVNRTSDMYDQETERGCLVDFRPRFSGIVAELKAKGLNVYYLESVADSRCPYDDEIGQLHNLAHWLDADGNSVRF